VTYPATLSSDIQRLASYLESNALKIATAESCTGGMLASSLTSMPGSSMWYEGGFVTYRISAKSKMLDIDPTLIRQHGAVSEVVARHMAQHTLTHCEAQLSIATTGLAGPAGDGTATAIGTLWIAWASAAREPHNAWVDAAQFELHMDREHFRETAVAFAIQGLLERVETKQDT